LVGAVILACAYALKWHYSTARPGQLVWVLFPTTAAVSLATGIEFAFEQGVGYVSRDRGIAVVASCAGVNFLIAAFCMLAFDGARRSRRFSSALGAAAWAAVMAYTATIVINTVRIVAAIACYGQGNVLPWIAGPAAHLLLGVAVYFGGLCGLFALRCRGRAMGRVRRRWWVWPIACYAAITAGVPVVNALLRGAPIPWGWYSVVVVGAPPVMVVLVACVKCMCTRRSVAVAR